MNDVERVHTVWDYYDAPRAGVADYGGVAHYFECGFDEDSGYTDIYRLWPIAEEFLAVALEQWRLHRAWELGFHSGELTVETHPNRGGRDAARYCELQEQIDRHRQELGPPGTEVLATFRARDGQPDLPKGCLRELEVSWRAIP